MRLGRTRAPPNRQPCDGPILVIFPTVQKTAQAFGFHIQPDAEPGADHYYRSDHFSMARAGVPAFSINTALKYAGHPTEWGKAQHDEYTAHRYHRPSDES